jgi:hypothetical protein
MESNKQLYRPDSCQSVAFEDKYGVTGHDARSQPRILSWRAALRDPMQPDHVELEFKGIEVPRSFPDDLLNVYVHIDRSHQKAVRRTIYLNTPSVSPERPIVRQQASQSLLRAILVHDDQSLWDIGVA